MEGAVRLSGGLIINLISTPTTKFKLTPSLKFTSPLQSLHLPHRISPTGNPTTLTSHAKLSGSTGDAPEEIDESFFEDEDEELIETDEEDESESSADLLIKFLQSMFKKASRHAKKASRSVLPAAISRQLVSFAVDGVLILASLSIIKALLESVIYLFTNAWNDGNDDCQKGLGQVVVCTLGGTVFVVILLLRVIWATISYFQTSGNGFSQSGTSFGTTQPVT